MKASQGYRTLFVTQLCPYPARGGGAMRVWQNINVLSRYGKVALFSVFKGARPELPLVDPALTHPALTHPAPTHPAQIDQGHHYDIGAPQRSQREKIVRRLGWLRPGGHPRADWLYTQPAAQQLQSLIQQFQPTLIICAEIWLYRYLPILRSAGCPVILDNHNVEGDADRFRPPSAQPSPSGLAIVQQRLALQNTLSKVRHIERHWLQQADQIWACSPTDRQLLKKLYPQVSASLQIVPNGIDPSVYAACRTSRLKPSTQLIPASTPTLLFPGRFSYPPNAEAAEMLIGQIYPVLKQRQPSCQLLLVGIDPTPQMIAAAADPDIVVTGEVADVRPYLATASVMGVPLQSGSGTRLKLLEAFAAGCPVVSTPKGAEGLAVADGQQLYLRSTPAAIAAAVLDLWEHPDQGQRLAQRAYECLLQDYAWSAVATRVEAALAGLS
ncbi:MAG: glycosyltransferase family 4 protein [Cyanobacteria bacterium P01_A01_bin.114]